SVPDALPNQVKQLENGPFDKSPGAQITRLTKSGSRYLNLNPYEVLKVSTDATMDTIKSHFRQLSKLVHPDKNKDQIERAQVAFEIISNSLKILEVAEQRGKLRLIIDEAMGVFNIKLKELRQEAKKNGFPGIDEDKIPEKYFRLKRATICKLFADYELKRQEIQQTDYHDKKRDREKELEAEEFFRMHEEWEKMW
ncbi:hypothetical protein MXB_2726, partial [Myxobolus squamalis]